jgi:hypothetical protein
MDKIQCFLNKTHVKLTRNNYCILNNRLSSYIVTELQSLLLTNSLLFLLEINQIIKSVRYV